MPQQQHHTLPTLDAQLRAVINEGWEQEVLPQLPADYEQQAEYLKAFVRQREIKRVADLLRALLAYVLCAPSFRQLGSWALLIGLANISNVAWRSRLRRARAWLLWLLCELLAVTIAPASQGHGSVQRIVLIDATRLKEPGGCGDDWAMICWLAGSSTSGWPTGTRLRASNSSCSARLMCWWPIAATAAAASWPMLCDEGHR